MTKDQYEVIESFTFGIKQCVKIIIYGRNIDQDPLFTFEIEMPNGNTIFWNSYLENYGGFEFETQKDAFDTALDILVDNSFYKEIDDKILENPEDNIEEVPEDFRLDMKN